MIRLSMNIKRIREERGLSQETLSLMCGFDKDFVRRLEGLKRCPRLDSLVKLANGLGLDVCDILQPADNKLVITKSEN